MWDECRVPPVLSADTVVTFCANASDNDRLTHVTVILTKEDGETMAINLGPFMPNHFEGRWRVPPDTAIWHYQYRAIDRWSNVTASPDTFWEFHVGPLETGKGVAILPTDFDLSTYPNPFNATTTISYALPHAGEASLAVYDLTGRLVRMLYHARADAGEHRITLNAAGMSSGIYFVRMEAGERVITRKIVLLR
jgi:hypothetical protein